MLSFRKWKSAPPTKVIRDIDGVLNDISHICTTNMELLADEERSSFMDEYSSLSDVRIGLSKSTKSTRLAEALEECEALKLKIQTTCRRRQEDMIRRGVRVSPATSGSTSTNELIRQSMDSNINTAPPSERSISNGFNSTPMSGDSLYTAPTQVRRRSIESGSNIPPLSEGPNSDRLNSASTNSTSWHTATTQVRRQSIESRVDTLSLLSQELGSTTTNGDSVSWHTTPMVAGTPAAATNVSVAQPAQQTIFTEDNRSASVSNDIDSMVFDPDSNVGSPTFNIDSEGATGSTQTLPSGSPPRIVPQARQHPTARIYQSQAARVVKRERVMYFGPGTTADSPTFNIRSPNASGAMEQVLVS